MHYDDKEVLKKNVAEIVIYIHSISGKPDVYAHHEYLITSIHKIQYTTLNFVRTFLNENYLKKLLKNKKLKSEEFYSIRFRERAQGFDIKVKNVSKSKNQFYQLH